MDAGLAETCGGAGRVGFPSPDVTHKRKTGERIGSGMVGIAVRVIHCILTQIATYAVSKPQRLTARMNSTRLRIAPGSVTV
jgi:hypothetical protein